MRHGFGQFRQVPAHFGDFVLQPSQPIRILAAAIPGSFGELTLQGTDDREPAPLEILS